MSRLGSLPSHYRIPKLVVTFLIFVPLAAVVLFFCLLLVGVMVSSIGLVKVGTLSRHFPLIFIGCLLLIVSLWFLYALAVSLWWDRRQASISFGLVFGLILLSIFAVNVASDLRNEFWHGALRWQTLGFSYVFFSSWLLTVGLLLHAMYGRRRV